MISVGYRISSTRATRFRIWATRILREHLIRGWTLNRQRIEENARELEAALALVRKTAQSPALGVETGRGLVDVATRYARTFLLLTHDLAHERHQLLESRWQAHLRCRICTKALRRPAPAVQE